MASAWASDGNDGASNDSGAGDGAAGLACSSSARVTSCFEIRPPRPLPLTSSAERPLSASARRADGAARTASGAGRPLPPPSALRPFAPELALRCGGAGAPAPSCSISAITSPTATVSPALRRILRRMPAPGEGTSTVAFSLSTSTSGSSTETSSPSACFQAPRVASRTDSPSAGTRSSIDI